MARRPSDDPPPDPPVRAFKLMIALSDQEPFRILLRDLARLHARMDASEVTVEEAADQLALILTTLMGTTM